MNMLQIIADQFLEGNLEVEDFRKQYIEKRILAHMRKVKAEKMQEILRNQNRGYNNPTRPAPPPPSNNWGGSALPYPIGQPSMPDSSSFLF